MALFKNLLQNLYSSLSLLQRNNVALVRKLSFIHGKEEGEHSLVNCSSGFLRMRIVLFMRLSSQFISIAIYAPATHSKITESLVEISFI